MDVIIGIDPGLTGAIAVLYGNRATLHDMPTVTAKNGRPEINHHELLSILSDAGGGDSAPRTVWLERVGAMPGQGVTSMFRFGQVLGAIEMACAACALPVRYVTPAVWKRHFGLVRDKDAARGLALQRFPDCASDLRRKKDAGRAEAALIALYGREATHV